METKQRWRDVFKASLLFFWAYPVCWLPMLVCWAGYAAIVLYADYGYSWAAHSGMENAAFLVGCYLVFSLLYGLASLILLEVMQQVESGERVSLGKAIADAVIKDLLRALPLLLAWGIVWFILAFLSALFSRKNKRGAAGSEKISAKNAVGTLLGRKNGFSLSSAFFDALSKGVRMLVFLMLPAVAWEEFSSIKSFKKGIAVLDDIRDDFLAAYATTAVFRTFVLLAPAVIYLVDDKIGLHLPEVFWIGVLIYMLIASSLSLIVEQIYVAELYLWHMDWEKTNKEREAAGKEPLPFGKTPKPSFFDGEYTLKT